MLKQQQKRLVYTGSVNPNDRDFYGTPPAWIGACREVMGSIELDPASCSVANEYIIHADKFFDEETNGLIQDWSCETLFLNPPYGRALRAFASKFHNEWEADKIGQAIILINNTTETAAFDLLSRCSSARAEVRKRIQFVNVEGRVDENNNTRGQVFFYCGKRVNTFTRVFKNLNCRVVGEL